MKPSAYLTSFMAFKLIVVGLLFGAWPALAIKPNPTISTGTGAYIMPGGLGHEEKQIKVFYHKPKNFTANSRVLIVLPGAGRSGRSYLRSWEKASEQHSLLVLSLKYDIKYYPEFWEYNIAGMVTDVKLNAAETEIVSHTAVKNPTDWIYSDFDRIFDDVIGKLKMNAKVYDMFGHSAGSQVLQRLTLFGLSDKVNRMLAANSGWYTMLDFEQPFPFGLKDAVVTKDQVKAAFQAKLILYLGEQDNKNETRGDLATGPYIDLQGDSRFTRGQHFFKHAKATAKKLGVTFNWKMVFVPGIGHSQKKISVPAADYLYL
ncbi:MAG: hypothetical protein MJK04_13060 [Psychrosphaera sp.]|nr:hypothetical protein [Psychrosphaera sp.]